MKKQRGFTLLELMVAVAIFAIVLTIATPSGLEFLANRQAVGASREIFNTLQHAKMMAIKEGRTVSIQYVPDISITDGFISLRVGFDTGTSEDDPLVIEDTELAFETQLPEGVLATLNKPSKSMQFNSRGILVAGDNGTVSVWSVLTLREYKLIVGNLGTLRLTMGIHAE